MSNASKVQIRLFVDSDAPALGRLMYDSIQQGTKGYYDVQQRQAWAPEPRVGDDWLQRLAQVYTLVAEDEQGPAGFMTLAPDGYIDLAYVRPDLIGVGVAQQLYSAIETQAQQSGIARLTSHASKLARGFFEKHGWRVVMPQTVERDGVLIPNYQMDKDLTR